MIDPVRRFFECRLGRSALLLAFSAMSLALSIQAQEAPQKLQAIALNAGMHLIQAELAQTPEQRSIGLMHRPKMGVNEGMLFVFPQNGKYSFWMKDMRFSIDILWLSANGRIVYMAQNVSPDTYPTGSIAIAICCSSNRARTKRSSRHAAST